MNGESPFAKRSGKTPRSPSSKPEPPVYRNLRSTTRTQSLEDLTTYSKHKQKAKPTEKLGAHSTEQVGTDTTTTKAIQIKNIEPNNEATNSTQVIPTDTPKASEIKNIETLTQKETTENLETNTKPTRKNKKESTETQTEVATTIEVSNTQTDNKTKNATNETLESITNTNTQQQVKMDRKQIQQQITAMVPEFSGADRLDRPNELARFLDTADSIYETLKTEEEKRTFTKLIKFKLTGDAYTRVSRRPTDSYDALSTTLNDLYAQIFSLDELERNFVTIYQSYGESLRNYGYRLIEALEQYKTGFRSKYNLNEIDDAYDKHLNQAAVQNFKKGLNNTILREKVATQRAKDVTEIIEETSEIEKMLIMMTNTPITTELKTNQNSQLNEDQKIPQTNNQATKTEVRNAITCNYCQKSNHTWDICRKRLNAERYQQNSYTTGTPFNTQYQQQRQYQPHFNANSYSKQDQNIRHTQHEQQPYTYQRQHYTNYQEPQHQQQPYTYQRQHYTNYQEPQHQQQPYMNNNSMRYTPPQQPYTPKYQQPDRPPKYCSHCKTTIGHTFEECRSKLRSVPIQTQQNHSNQEPRQWQQDSNLEAMFGNMKINMIAPQKTYNPNTEAERHQGNASGSNQR